MKKIWKHRYQIMEETGTGGNGTVYKVWDLHLEKEWAMKILEEKAGCIRGTNMEEAIDEMTALKRISHPNFPRIVDAFEEDGKNILIMDYIGGVTLEKIIEKGPMKEEEMVFILIQVCDAILYLHQSTPALLYLDLKPSNIMIEENKNVRLVDLGSVSVKGKRGKISGSFGYASPEQVKVQREGIFLMEQSDIFSFGMVMYAMATGNSSKLPIMEAKTRHGFFIRRENPFFSGMLEKIIEKCTRGNYNRRYTSMREIRKDLEIWETCLKKKGAAMSLRIPLFRGSNKKQWYQEKSIFCTEGKHSFYIARKILILMIGICCLLPGKMIWAGEKSKVFSDEEVKSAAREEYRQERSEQSREEQKLKIVIRDNQFRKVLVRAGCAYETDSNILLEIPWEEIKGKQCQITVECEDESQEKKRFYIECIYAK